MVNIKRERTFSWGKRGCRKVLTQRVILLLDQEEYQIEQKFHTNYPSASRKEMINLSAAGKWQQWILCDSTVMQISYVVYIERKIGTSTVTAHLNLQ